MRYQSTQPDSKGKAAALKRAAQLTEFTWTPLRDVPTHTKQAGRTVLPAGVPVKGMPYSSTEANDKFITENVSFETLLSAMANPDSVLYQKSLEGRNSSTYYGIVCNSLVRYCLGISGRYNTKRWGDIPGMYLIKEQGTYTPDDMELGDVLHAFGNGRNHVALITDLLKDESGRIVEVEVSEAVSPSCKRASYPVEEFHEKYALFSLWRYALIDELPESDPALDELLFAGGVEVQKSDIAIDYGNKSNYPEGEETVISLFRDAENLVEIRRGDELIEQLKVSGSGQIRRTFTGGYYTITLRNTGERVEFCVNAPHISHTVENEYIHITVDSGDPESQILHMEFREKGEDTASLVAIEQLSPREKRTGAFTRKIPAEGENYKISFRNRYGVWTHRMLPIKEKTLYSTLPDTPGKAEALKRAAQLTEFRWTPIRDIPTYTGNTGKTVFPAGVEVKGMIYSSPERVDKFVTENVSFETLLSAMANPDSVLYEKDLGGASNSWAYYGIVCNGLARYALNIKGRYSTKRWPTLDGMEMVKPCGEYTAEEMELCDILYAHGNGRSHVAMITDLLRDDTGKVVRVEVSEAVRPSCIRKSYERESFFEKFSLYGLWRYAYVDQTPAGNPREAALLAAGVPDGQHIGIAVDHGNRSNYLEGEETVISVFREGKQEVEIRRGDVVTERITVNDGGQIRRKLAPGYYTVTLSGTGETAEFCVNCPVISHSAEAGWITVTANSGDPESEIYYMDFRELGSGGPAAALAKLEKLSPQEIESGVIRRQIPEDGVHFKVYFRNRYGVWTHRMIPIK